MSHHNEDYEKSELYRIRHSASHVMAEAVLEMFPNARVAIGPAIEDGFYYDFDLPRSLTRRTLKSSKTRMKELIKSKEEFVYQEISADKAREIFKDQPYKLELIDGLEHGNLDDDGNPPRKNRSSQLTRRVSLWTCAADHMWNQPRRSILSRLNC